MPLQRHLIVPSDACWFLTVFQRPLTAELKSWVCARWAWQAEVPRVEIRRARHTCVHCCAASDKSRIMEDANLWRLTSSPLRSTVTTANSVFNSPYTICWVSVYPSVSVSTCPSVWFYVTGSDEAGPAGALGRNNAVKQCPILYTSVVNHNAGGPSVLWFICHRRRISRHLAMLL